MISTYIKEIALITKTRVDAENKHTEMPYGIEQTIFNKIYSKKHKSKQFL